MEKCEICGDYSGHRVMYAGGVSAVLCIKCNRELTGWAEHLEIHGQCLQANNELTAATIAYRGSCDEIHKDKLEVLLARVDSVKSEFSNQIRAWILSRIDKPSPSNPWAYCNP